MDGLTKKIPELLCYHWFRLLKVSKFQNEFLKSLFLPIYEPNIVKISALLHCATLQGRNPYNF